MSSWSECSVVFTLGLWWIMVVEPQKRVTFLRIFGRMKFLCHEDPSQVSSTPWWQWLNSSAGAVCTKGVLEGVCGRLHWFLPSLPFFHCFPSADTEIWLNNLIPWWQMQMKQDRYLDPISMWPWRRWLHYCYSVNFWVPRFLLLIHPQKSHRWQRRERKMCKI